MIRILSKCLFSNPEYSLLKSRHLATITTRQSQLEGGLNFEIHNGVGGSEAMLFANEMFDVYLRFMSARGWLYEVLEQDQSSLGGLKSAKLLVKSPGAFGNLVQEAGVHRVQRVPKTEKHGRMHTSTITVAVIPQSVVNIQINENDLEILTKRSSGPGGQHVNKTESAVQIIHKPSGVMVESQESRVQQENRKIAMQKLLAKLQGAEFDKVTTAEVKLKKGQVGNADRNEKIRTYNFSQDRITDHRIQKSYQGLKRLIAGDTSILEKMIKDFHDR